MGVSAAVGSATVAALTGTAWAGTPVDGVPAQRPPSPAAHRCGHADTIAVTAGSPSAEGAALTVEAVDGAADPVEAAFDGTTLLVRIPGQRTAPPASGSPAADVRAVLPAGDRSRSYEVRAVATFDDGITECSWTTRVVVPPRS
jgi:hypothetical protein